MSTSLSTILMSLSELDLQRTSTSAPLSSANFNVRSALSAREGWEGFDVRQDNELQPIKRENAMNRLRASTQDFLLLVFGPRELRMSCKRHACAATKHAGFPAHPKNVSASPVASDDKHRFRPRRVGSLSEIPLRPLGPSSPNASRCSTFVELRQSSLSGAYCPQQRKRGKTALALDRRSQGHTVVEVDGEGNPVVAADVNGRARPLAERLQAKARATRREAQMAMAKAGAEAAAKAGAKAAAKAAVAKAKAVVGDVRAPADREPTGDTPPGVRPRRDE